MQHEREISLPAIVRSTEPSVMLLSKEHFPQLLAFVTLCTKTYLDYTFPNQSGIAAMFANDLIETRPTWKAMDFPNMFKFFRQRQDIEGLKVFGNTITGQKLMEMVAVYEDQRAAEMEKYQREKSQSEKHTDRLYNDNSIKSLMGRTADEVAAKQEELRQKGKLKERTVAPDENYFSKVHGVKP